MVDEIYDRTYQAGREDLHAGIDRALGHLGRGIRTTLDVLHTIEWSAPWNKPAGKSNHTGHA